MSDIELICSNGFVLSTDGTTVFVTHGRTTESYEIANIQQVHFKEPGMMYGEIGFKDGGTNSAGVRVARGISIGIGSDHNYFYRKSDYQTALKFKEVLENPASAATGTVVSVVDEIRGLKQLLDEGILTEEEFTKKKKQLLGI
jgi:hypothetical protein